MTALVAVEVEVTRQIFYNRSCHVVLEIDLLVFHRSPESLDHHVVNRAALAVHTDRDIL